VRSCHMDSNRCGAVSSVRPARDVPARFEGRRPADRASLRMTGELDLATVDEFVSRIRERIAPGNALTVDLRGLTFMSAAGVSACLSVQRDARASDCAVTFVHAQGIVARVLRILDVEAILSTGEGRP
jgi:anti-anti-sigma factor